MVLEYPDDHLRAHLPQLLYLQHHLNACHGMLSYEPPFVIVQLIGFIENLLGYLRLSHIMQKAGHPQFHQRLLGETQSPPHGQGVNGNVYAMVEGVFVVILYRGQSEEYRFILYHEIDGSLDHSLHLSGADELILLNPGDHPFDDPDGFEEELLSGLFGICLATKEFVLLKDLKGFNLNGFDFELIQIFL